MFWLSKLKYERIFTRGDFVMKKYPYRYHYKDSKEFMNWYHNLDENRKKEHNRQRYQKAKARKLAKLRELNV